MTSLKLGRAEVSECLSTLQMGNDDTLDLGGWFSGATLPEAFGLRQQLLGLGSRDEPVIPVVSELDPKLDGFYEVLGVSVDAEHDFSYDTRPEMIGAHRWSASLRRVAGGYSRPQFEVLVSTAVRANAHSVASPNGIVAALPITPLSASAREYDYTTVPTAGAAGTLVTADGDVELASAVAPTSGYWSGYVKPASYYIGTPRIEVLYGSVWLAVHGQQIPLDVAGNWRISNGFCRVYPSATGVGGKKGFTVETFRAGSWVGCEFVGWTYSAVLPGWIGPRDATGDSTGYSSPTILTNTPDVVSIRVAGSMGRLTLTLRAGETWVVAQCTGSLVGLGRSTATASTGFTGGVRATANDANGLRYLMASCAQTGAGSQVDGANGRIQAATAYPKVYAITADYQVGPFTTDTGVRDGFYAACYTRRKVVGR